VARFINLYQRNRKNKHIYIGICTNPRGETCRWELTTSKYTYRDEKPCKSPFLAHSANDSTISKLAKMIVKTDLLNLKFLTAENDFNRWSSKIIGWLRDPKDSAKLIWQMIVKIYVDSPNVRNRIDASIRKLFGFVFVYYKPQQ
jgi:hypothetical protein